MPRNRRKLILCLAYHIHRRNEILKVRRKYWCRNRYRDSDEFLRKLYNDLKMEDGIGLQQQTRLLPAEFEEILQSIGQEIRKDDTLLRKSNKPPSKLLITLLHLAHGITYVAMSGLFSVGKSTIIGFIPEVCDAIVRALQDF